MSYLLFLVSITISDDPLLQSTSDQHVYPSSLANEENNKPQILDKHSLPEPRCLLQSEQRPDEYNFVDGQREESLLVQTGEAYPQRWDLPSCCTQNTETTTCCRNIPSPSYPQSFENFWQNQEGGLSTLNESDVNFPPLFPEMTCLPESWLPFENENHDGTEADQLQFFWTEF